jgi:hypothetical protein
MAYIGAAPSGFNPYVPVSVAYSGNGSATVFTLPASVSNNVQVEVVVNNIQQNPFSTSYTASGTTLTFSEAPSAGTNNVVVTYRTVVA